MTTITHLWEKMLSTFDFKSIESTFYWDLVTILITSAAVIYAYKQYRLKKNIHIESSFTINSTVIYNNSYVKDVVLVNLKDKTEAVFGIYLKIGCNIYIELERNDREPILLGPFETVVRRYNPVTIYSFSNYNIDITKTLTSREYLKNARIAIASTKGKYITRRIKEHWNPIIDHLRNPYILPISCIQAVDDDTEVTIPDNAQFIVFYKENNVDKKCYIYKKGKAFKNKQRWLNISEEDIDNQQELLNKIKSLETLSTTDIDPSSIKLKDVDEIASVKYINETYDENISLEPSGWFETIIIGKLSNLIDRNKLWRANRRRK